MTQEIDPHIAERLASVFEFLTKLGGVVGALWVAIAKVAKPYQEWRRQHLAATMREVFAPELKVLADAVASEHSCADRMDRVLARQEALFDDFDLQLVIVADTRERQDETNALLDEVLSLERRIDDERRQEVKKMIDTLHDRRAARRRTLD